MHSNAMIELSEINLPGIKTLWFSDINSDRMGRNRFTKNLETILYITLHRLIGVKSLAPLGEELLELELEPHR